jgi:hypothetical protein
MTGITSILLPYPGGKSPNVVENTLPLAIFLIPSNNLSYNLPDGKSIYNSQLVHESVHNSSEIKG